MKFTALATASMLTLSFLLCGMTARAASPSDLAEPHLKSGDDKAKKQDNEGAIADYSKAIEIDPSSATAFTRRAKAWQAMRDYDRAITDYARAVELAPGKAENHFLIGFCHLNKEEHAAAIPSLTKAAQLDPGNAPVYMLRGMCRSRTNDKAGALEDYTRFIELNPKLKTWGYLSRGGIKASMDDLPGALADCNKAIELDASQYLAYQRRADIHFCLGKNAEAERDLRQSLQLAKPEEALYPHLHLFALQARLGDPASGRDLRDFWNDHHKIFGDQAPPVSIIQFLLGRLSEQDLLAAAKATNPQKNDGQHCEAWFLAGMKHLASGDKQQAVDCLEKAVATHADMAAEHAMARAELARLETLK
ncbi:MAG: tetratricopeptide repeat protein [Prosthecobacter sp.]